MHKYLIRKSIFVSYLLTSNAVCEMWENHFLCTWTLSQKYCVVESWVNYDLLELSGKTKGSFVSPIMFHMQVDIVAETHSLPTGSCLMCSHILHCRMAGGSNDPGSMVPHTLLHPTAYWYGAKNTLLCSIFTISDIYSFTQKHLEALRAYTR